MSYIRGETYIWEGEDGVHVWGEHDPSMLDSVWAQNYPTGKAGVFIPKESWEIVKKTVIDRYLHPPAATLDDIPE